MASFSKSLLPLLISGLLVSCGQTGGIAPLAINGDVFDYSICDKIITTSMTGNSFSSELQDGTSTDFFTVCLEKGVTITSANITHNFVALVGVSKEESIIENLVYSTSSNTKSLAVSRMTLKKSGGMGQGCFTAGNSVSGTLTASLDNIICYAPSTGGPSTTGIGGTTSAGGNIVLNISNSIINSAGDGIRLTISAGGSITSTISENTINVAGNGISLTESANSWVNVNLKGNRIQMDGTIQGPFPSAYGISATASANGGININETSSSVKNFVCNKPTTVSTFSGVFSATSSAGAGIGGTFAASGTQNAGNTVGTCP